jgi:DNA primase
MVAYTKESLEELRSKIQLLEVVSPHLRISKSGSHYKALCPFHSEKSPSFVIQSGDSHYHCFGCGAHGDAIAFQMNYLQMTFVEAVESLAEKFAVRLETGKDDKEIKDPDLKPAKDSLNEAAEFFHFFLLHTDEGHQALDYLYSRGIDNQLIHQFKIGLSPKDPNLFLSIMKEAKFSQEALLLAGLLKQNDKKQIRPFFSDRITIPIHHPMGYVIGFSARSFKQDAFGPKYVNTAETPFFKKSKILFGYHYSRKRIAKEQKVIIVEGQFDALRLISEGFNYTVASQGTAFGEEGVSELVRIGVRNVYLAFDSDTAGKEAAIKVGQLFQKEAIAVWIVQLPEGSDPDSTVRDEGAERFIEYLNQAIEYLDFLIQFYRGKINVNTPAGKNDVVRTVSSLIRAWEHPLMVHEGLKKLAREMQIPESVVDVGEPASPEVYVRSSLSVSQASFDPDRILETDLLRLMILASATYPEILPYISEHIGKDSFFVPICQKVFQEILLQYEKEKSIDLIPLVTEMEGAEQQLFLADILQKKILVERAKDSTVLTVKKILQRNWMRKREEIKAKIQSGGISDKEVLELAKVFDDIKRAPPIVKDFA